MSLKPDDLPFDLAGAYMVLLAERETLQAERDVAVADAANARAMARMRRPYPERLEGFGRPEAEAPPQSRLIGIIGPRSPATV